MIMFTVCKQLGLRLLNPDLQSSPRKWLIRRVVALPTSFVVVLTAKNLYWPFRNSAGNWGDFHILTNR